MNTKEQITKVKKEMGVLQQSLYNLNKTLKEEKIKINDINVGDVFSKNDNSDQLLFVMKGHGEDSWYLSGLFNSFLHAFLTSDGIKDNVINYLNYREYEKIGEIELLYEKDDFSGDFIFEAKFKRIIC